VTPAFAVALPASADELDLPGTLASLHASAARAGLPYEIVVGVNGPGEPSAAVLGTRAFARTAGLPLVEDGSPDPPAPRVRLLRLAPRSKVVAWNAIRAATRAPLLVFADADVRVAPDAVPLLIRRLETEPGLTAVAGREVATLAAADGLAARAAALPYRFDFGNIPGRLYALRSAALPDVMPVSVLAEDAYLTVRIGRAGFAKERDAVVYFRPPGTWRDYLRQRVRHELGKLQLEREFSALHRAHGFGRTPWGSFVRAIAPREYPLVALSLATRLVARVRALWTIRDGFPTGWAVLPSTKSWPEA
jgi:hypothetical protein